ncbi:hypothetical protein HER32_11350 [Hymenobacter sp. BT18]|uniref:hypothetical protein n=1 Tax=Hymenobacter sp. BT18 TaxID=2835648 RepID=UPI00143EE324|nr:hypothetical protein [Hymenobacter sp. BT18]QIX61739.1 hypothetical protein HER32_11350 [Hymenobacter sp. BT18]
MHLFRSLGRLAALVIVGLLLAPPAAQAQKYRTAGGVRYSTGSLGLTLQQKILEKATLEGIALASSREVSATVLAERHFPVLGPSLNYYLGAGGHLGTHKDNGGFGGFDGMLGVEYKVAFTRLLLSADFKPSIEFGGEDWARFPVGFSLRYVIVQDKSKGFLGIFGSDDDKKKSKSKEGKSKQKGSGIFGL